MEGDSDAEEFYDAAEFPISSTPVKDEPGKTSVCQTQEESSHGSSMDDPSLNERHCKDHLEILSHDTDSTSSKPTSECNGKDETILKNSTGQADKMDRKSELLCSDIKERATSEDKPTVLISCENILLNENEHKEHEINENIKDHQDEKNAQNRLNITPVAPPRRKKKNKARPQPVQKLGLTGDEDFTKEGKQDDQKKEEEDKNNGATNETPKESFHGSQDHETLKESFHGSQDQCDAGGDTVDSDLDISTQEMSEILDRNNFTEVISPQHVSVHLQRNKSQSISSIGSFCSVSSNISFQDKMKRSTSQGSLGSINTNEKAPAPADQLTDQEILEQVVVKNLDTGECIPLSEAEKHVPTGVNPLALHIMRLTSEFSSKQDLAGSDRDDNMDGGVSETVRKITRKKKNLRGLFGRKVQKLKTTKDGSKRAEESSSSDEDSPQHPDSYIKIKSANGKGIPIINKLSLIQDLSGQHQGAVWTMKFSCCGKLLATAGQDKVVHVWVLKNDKNYFEQMRARYAKADKERPASPNSEKVENNEEAAEKDKDAGGSVTDTDYPEGFCKEPFCTYRGHIGDVLDLSWSKNYFLLSSSMDKTVRLWHISRSECLCCFQHIDFVTAITFHPRDDRYFLSGSLDGKIRLWNIPDKKVALWNELEGAGSNLITAANFCMNGKFAVVGTYDGRCIFYETEHLKYFTQWQVRSTRKKQGRKISGIEPMPGEDKILITSNDSRIRLYSLKDHSLHCKYKGFSNSSSQIKGSFSHDGEFVISGSEDHFVYMWRAQHRVPSSRKDRNDFYESFSAHNAVVTAAIFAPCPWNVVPTEYDENSTGSTGPEVIVAADWTGSIKIFINRYQNEKANP